jgi:hypothetical protein
MSFRPLVRRALVIALAAAAPAFGQSGLRVPERSEPGIDPGFARGWLAPEFDRFGFASYPAMGMGFTPQQRMNWSYSFGERTSLGLSVNSRDYDYDTRAVSLFGRYWFANDWAVSAESISRDPGGFWRPQDFRIGVQRRF